MSKFTRKCCEKKKRSNYFKKAGIYLSIFSAIFVLLFFYFSQVNSSASRAFEIQELESELSVLENKNEQLKLDITGLESMKNLEERIVKLNLVKANEVAYVEEHSVIMAAK